MRYSLAIAVFLGTIKSSKLHKKTSIATQAESEDLEDMQLLSQDGIEKLLKYGTNAEGSLVQIN